MTVSGVRGEDGLRAAAKRLDALPHAAMTYGWFDADGHPILLWGPAHARALALLLDTFADYSASGNEIPAMRGPLLDAALALAEQVNPEDQS